MNLTSYRFRIPLSLAAVAAVTAIALSIAIAYQTYLNVEVDQQRAGFRLAHAMEPVLARALKHDDVWLAFSVLRGPSSANAADTAAPPPFLVLLDEQQRVFAANQPERFPIGTALADIDGMLARQRRPADDGAPTAFYWRGGQVLVAQVHSDDAVVGVLIIGFSTGAFWQRFQEILVKGSPVVAVILAVLILLGWLWGRRMITPLSNLSHCMERIGRDDVTALQCPTYLGTDEIARLGQSFQILLGDLKNKKALEEQAMVQERLAAIGRVAAGVAHEINNPLGGLLAAIDTYRHKPAAARDPDKTLALVERGLHQIHATVSALLVEGRAETRPLIHHDIDDIATLVRADAAAAYKTIEWRNDLAGELPLPAHAVRQILLNLVLNALQATAPGGEVTVDLAACATDLKIVVSNRGEPIPPAVMKHLFEPFHSRRPGGTGLGLWVTYQTVTQLGGSIGVQNDQEQTRLMVNLPLGTAHSEVA